MDPDATDDGLMKSGASGIWGIARFQTNSVTKQSWPRFTLDSGGREMRLIM